MHLEFVIAINSGHFSAIIFSGFSPIPFSLLDSATLTVSKPSFCIPYLSLFFLGLFYVQMFCLHVCMYIMYMLCAGQRSEDGVGFFETGVMYGFEPSCESWELNLGLCKSNKYS